MSLAEARPERAVVGLDLVADQLGLLGHEVELLDVELGADELGEPLDRRALGVGRRRPPPCASGWRTFTFAWARAARPSSTVRRAASIAASSSGSRERLVGLGEVARGGPSRAVGEVSASPPDEVGVDLVGDERGERGEQLRGLERGSGAASRRRPRSPSQKRRRERRTYQLESSSTKAAIARPAVVASKSSRRSRTVAIVACSRESDPAVELVPRAAVRRSTGSRSVSSPSAFA